MTGKEHRRDFPDHIIQEAAERFGIPNMTADFWRKHLKINDLFCALCQAVSEIKEERKAILSFIEETVDWDGVDYEKLTNWIKERGV
jgi:hypothetical protein